MDSFRETEPFFDPNPHPKLWVQVARVVDSPTRLIWPQTFVEAIVVVTNHMYLVGDCRS
jgi:hypothetical protein